MRQVSGSAVYYLDSRYLEMTVVFEDETDYIVDAIELVALSPLNAAGYPLLPEPMVLTKDHGNLSNTTGVASLRGSINNIPVPSVIDVQLRDTDGNTYKIEVIPQRRDKRLTELGPELNQDEIIKP